MEHLSLAKAFWRVFQRLAELVVVVSISPIFEQINVAWVHVSVDSISPPFLGDGVMLAANCESARKIFGFFGQRPAGKGKSWQRGIPFVTAGFGGMLQLVR